MKTIQVPFKKPLSTDSLHNIDYAKIQFDAGFYPPQPGNFLKWSVETNIHPAGDTTSSVTLTDFLEPSIEGVYGGGLVEACTAVGSLYGYSRAVDMLSCAHLIPEEWQQFVIIFPGTIVHQHRTKGKHPIIPVLTWFRDKPRSDDGWKVRWRFKNTFWNRGFKVIKILDSVT